METRHRHAIHGQHNRGTLALVKRKQDIQSHR
jgi:hypothetical protein